MVLKMLMNTLGNSAFLEGLRVSFILFSTYLNIASKLHKHFCKGSSKARFPLGEFVRATRSENMNSAT